MAINFKKGFFRLWIVLSFLWIAFACFVFGPDTIKSLNILPTQKTFEKAFENERKRLLRERQDEKKRYMKKS
jgi:hypothetical protein